MMQRLDCLPSSGGAIQHAGQTIHWLVQSSAAHPALSLGRPPLGLLHPTEEARLADLIYPKRRHSWLLGRWTAKHLLQSVFQPIAGGRLPLNQLVIHNDRSGAPFVLLASETRFLRENGFLKPSETGRLPVSLSISHSGDNGFCAVSMADPAHTPYSPLSVGADIERIEPRGLSFAADFFSPPEIAHIRSTQADRRDTLITTIWSAKEATLKALGLGLTIDTLRLVCHLDWPDTEPLDGWRSFTVTTPDLVASSLVLIGWWRTFDGYTLTLAVTHPDNALRITSYT